jgi:uncharacterized protein YjbJ (UPF0337 family)
MADWDQVEGQAKETAGDATGDEGLEGEGKMQGAKGDVEERAGDMGDELKERGGDAADEVRDRI